MLYLPEFGTTYSHPNDSKEHVVIAYSELCYQGSFTTFPRAQPCNCAKSVSALQQNSGKKDCPTSLWDMRWFLSAVSS